MASSSRLPVELSVDQRSIVAAGKALKLEADGKTLRRELLRELKATAEPLAVDLRAAARALPAHSALSPGGPSLRVAISSAIKPAVRMSGQNTGVSVKARKVNLRGFSMAARRMNRDSFRHKVFGRDVWVNQTGKPGWFDEVTKGRRDDIRRAVMKAVDDTVARIASRTKGS